MVPVSLQLNGTNKIHLITHIVYKINVRTCYINK